MKWVAGRLVLDTPADYHFGHVLAYLNRYESECLHQVDGCFVYKALRLDGLVVMMELQLGDGGARGDGTVGGEGNEVGVAEAAGAVNGEQPRLLPEERELLERNISIRFLNGEPGERMMRQAVAYVREWLDLDTPLEEFYRIAAGDHLLGPVVRQFKGLRVIGVPSLLEALSWTVIGQQINLSFAYTLKRRLVEAFGTRIDFEGRQWMLFPDAALLAELDPERLLELKFSRTKAATLQLIAQLIASGELSKEQLLQDNDFAYAEQRLIAIRGIGPWTANYVAMRCLRNRDAFPLADVGLHHAIRRRLNLPEKPALPQVEQLAEGWKPWRAYATFYLWSTLLPQ